MITKYWSDTERPKDIFRSEHDVLAQWQELTEETGYTRNVARAVSGKAEELHGKSQIQTWRILTAELSKRPALELLEALSDYGFSWRHIAQMVGVSVPAIRKWRKGQRVSPDSHRELAAVKAIVQMVQENYLVPEVASWFEMPILKGVSVTPVDLFSADQPDLVFEHARGQVDPEEILTKLDPNWRETYASAFEVFEASDGNYSIKPKA